MHASCSLQSELRPVLGTGSTSRFSSPLYLPLSHVCSSRPKGHDDLTSSPPSSELTPAVFYESPPFRAGNIDQGLRSLRDLTQHLTTRADDSHAPPVLGPEGHHISVAFPSMSNLGKVFRVASN